MKWKCPLTIVFYGTFSLHNISEHDTIVSYSFKVRTKSDEYVQFKLSRTSVVYIFKQNETEKDIK